MLLLVAQEQAMGKQNLATLQCLIDHLHSIRYMLSIYRMPDSIEMWAVIESLKSKKVEMGKQRNTGKTATT